MLASQVTGQRERGFAQRPFWVVIVFDLDAIVGVIAHTARSIQRIFTECVLIPQDGKPAIRTPQDLPSDAGPIVKPSVGLPSVDEPGLNLQVCRGENLYSHAVEKPRRV